MGGWEYGQEVLAGSALWLGGQLGEHGQGLSAVNGCQRGRLGSGQCDESCLVRVGAGVGGQEDGWMHERCLCGGVASGEPLIAVNHIPNPGVCKKKL